jgi:hypothetical protein
VSGEPPAASTPEWLRAAVRPLWAEGLHLDRNEVLLTVRDEADRLLHLELSQGAGRDALCRIGDVSVSYRFPEAPRGGVPEDDHKRAAARCRELAARLAPYAEALSAAVRALRLAPRPREGRSLLFYEDDLLRAKEPAAEVTRVLAQSRAAAPDLPLDAVTLHLDEPCDQACRFCWYAQERDDAEVLGARRWRRARNADDETSVVSAARAILAALAAQSPPGQFVLFGYDWSRHPDLDALFGLLEAEERVPCVLVGPGKALASRGLVQRLARLRAPVRVELGLHGHEAGTHDALVGHPGAHGAVWESIAALRDGGIDTTLSTLVTPSNVDELPALLASLVGQVQRVRLSVFRPERLLRARRQGWDLEGLAVPPVVLRRALEATLAAGLPEGFIEALDAFAVCAAPPELRPHLSRTPPSPAEPAFSHYAPCAACRHRERCVGVSEAVAERFGPEAVAPEPAAAQ